MTLLTRTELNQLLEPMTWPCLSLYLPTRRLGRETQQAPIRLKNLLRESERRLETLEIRKRDAVELLRPGWRLHADSLFWQHQQDGLAIFLSPRSSVHFRLPLRFEELLVVADRFHVKPLLSFLSGDGRFYVLALSQNEVRLLEGSRYSVTELERNEMPEDLRKALGPVARRPQLQFRTQGRSADKRSAIFHGHGPGAEDSKVRLLRYFRIIDSALVRHLTLERAPLVLAGVEYYFGLYRQVSNYPYLIDGVIAGNPEAETIDDLHKRALHLLAPRLDRDRAEAAARYRELVGTGRTSLSLADVVPAAIRGQVEVIFVAIDVQLWGSVDDVGRIVRHDVPGPHDFDLLDLAAVHSLVQGGTVYAVRLAEMPDQSPIIAILR